MLRFLLMESDMMLWVRCAAVRYQRRQDD